MKIFNHNYYKAISLLGMISCILWVIIVKTQPFSDFNYYNELAKSIANGGQCGDTYTFVGYSIILGFIYSIFGSSLIIAKIFNLILTFFTYIIFYKILYKLELSEIRRRIIYAVFIFFPNNIFYNSILGTEILFTTILLMITLIYHSNVKFKYVLIGILTGQGRYSFPFTFVIIHFFSFLVERIIGEKGKKSQTYLLNKEHTEIHVKPITFLKSLLV